MRRAVILLVGLLAVVGRTVGAEEPAVLLRSEMQRRNSDLVQRGFNMTQQIELRAHETASIALLVPPSSDAHELSFWAHAVGGDVALRIASAEGKPLACWDGMSGEMSLTVELPAGKSSVEIDGTRAEATFGILGVKGPVLRDCRTDAGRVRMRAANASAGFHWPYLLYAPPEVRLPFLLVAPNNTGFATADLNLLAADARCSVTSTSALADRLGVPALVPLFPRPPASGEGEDLYLHALTRASLQTRVPEYARVDLQLMAMIDDARSVLASRGAEVSRRVLMTGFSASGSFASRFAMLHPDRVLAVASGSPGGWPIAPVAKDGGLALPYPVGIADVDSLVGGAPSSAELKKVAWFFFLGDGDTNDSVPYRDSFSKADETLVFQHFGPTPVARWKDAARLYGSKGLNAQFKLYPGVAHEVSQEMRADIEAFFLAASGSASARTRAE